MPGRIGVHAAQLLIEAITCIGLQADFVNLTFEHPASANLQT